MSNIKSRSATAEDAIAQGKFQPILYKYRGTSDKTDSILKDCKLWFAKPSTFNDPFDCSLSEVATHTQADVTAFYQHIVQGKLPADVAKLPPPTAALLEPILEKSKETAMEGTGVLAMSQKVDNILMWSHYAENHAGLALEFDITRDLKCFDGLLNMDYVDTYTPTNYFRDQMDSITRIIKTKSKHWSYEKEVRIMKTKYNGLVPFHPESLRRIFFGCKATPEFIDRIRTLCSTPALKHVTFAKMAKVYGAFRLDAMPLP